LFVQYLSTINLFPLLDDSFAGLRKSSKGLPIWNLFKQIFVFLFDGSSPHLVYFDDLAKDKGYAAIVENTMAEMASSHTMKRFFKSFGRFACTPFRKILNMLFVWRLKRENPRVFEATIDTMVMNNDDAEHREGVGPTYKKVKGFQPLQLIWNGKIIDAVFRGGKKNGNAGDTVLNMMERMVKTIRDTCGPDILIILRVDAGFFDQRILEKATKLGIAIIMSGKMYCTVKDIVSGIPLEYWGEFANGRQTWQYTEFGWRCKEWGRFYRTFYTWPTGETDGQLLFEFKRPENIILTNLGIDPEVLASCTAKERAHWLDPKTIIASHHARGADELPHRGLKDFGFEQLPFKRFSANQAFYYCMLIGFFLLETFKEDVLREVIPITSYATTVRRKVIDIAVKIIRTQKQTIMKIPRAIMESLHFDELWNLSRTSPPIPITIE